MLVNIFDHSFPKDMNADVCGNNNWYKSIKGDAAMVDANTERHPRRIRWLFGKEVFTIVLRRYTFVYYCIMIILFLAWTLFQNTRHTAFY
jgi:hypothetical protein